MRNCCINIRTTKQEHDAVARRAKDSGLNISEYVRRCSLNETDRPVIHVDTKLLHDIYRTLRRTGGNINQIAHWLNTHSSITEPFSNQLETTLAANAEASSELANFIATVKASV